MAKIWRIIGEVGSYNIEGSLDDVILYFQQLQLKHIGKKLKILHERVKYEDYYVYTLYFEDDETVEEIAFRERYERERKENQETYDRQQLAKLKQKYEGA